MQSLEPYELQEAMARLPHWTHDPERAALVRSFIFPDFPEAFAFMTQMAILSEKQDHHPEWFNVHRRVDVSLTTHDAEGVSARDISWARVADLVATDHRVLPPSSGV